MIDESEEIKTTIFEEARIGVNVHPAKFEKEKIGEGEILVHNTLIKRSSTVQLYA